MIPRMFIGGKIPLSFVHLLQDCIFETNYECNRANYFYQTGYAKHNPVFPVGILAEIQTHKKVFVSYVTLDDDIDFFISSEYEKCMEWMIEKIEKVKEGY